MNGAQELCEALLRNDVRVCFANPGTSEMHFVAALDQRSEMRCVLGLQENIVTGAADGYGRMTDTPAAVLLHLGPGLANGLGNLHNARRGRTPVINIVGDHATYHLAADAPLTSDIEGLAWPMSHYVRRISGGSEIAHATAEAYDAATGLPGVATLILPADVAWTPVGSAPPTPDRIARVSRWSAGRVREVAEALSRALRDRKRIALLLGGRALRERSLVIADRIAQHVNARLLCGPLAARTERGAGRVALEKIPYPIGPALEMLREVDLVVRIDADTPVAFFAYPGAPCALLPPAAEQVVLSAAGEDATGALQALTEQLGVPETLQPRRVARAAVTKEADSVLNADATCRAIASCLPEQAIICDEALTATAALHQHTVAAPAHDYLQITGGAIGIGIPLSIGAAIACPSRKVINVQADGSAMYTIQGLWTQAREALDVVTIILSNRSYAILHHEMRGVGVTQLGPNARRMLDLDNPVLDFVGIARGLGVEAVKARTTAELRAALVEAMRQRGPFLIEAVL